MADQEAFDEQAFYDHVKRAEAEWGNNLQRRHHKAALRDLLNWMDRSGAMKAEGPSPGVKAAKLAADPTVQQKEMEGRLKITGETPKVQGDPVPVGEQPTSFEAASEKAHEAFMQAIGKDK